MATYQLFYMYTGDLYDGVKRIADGMIIPNAAGNKDWQAYQVWLAEGNEPNPADPPPLVKVDVRDANQRLDAGIAAAQEPLAAADAAGKRRTRTTDDQIAALQQQVNALQTAMESMLQAQTGKTPR